MVERTERVSSPNARTQRINDVASETKYTAKKLQARRVEDTLEELEDVV